MAIPFSKTLQTISEFLASLEKNAQTVTGFVHAGEFTQDLLFRNIRTTCKTLGKDTKVLVGAKLDANVLEEALYTEQLFSTPAVYCVRCDSKNQSLDKFFKSVTELPATINHIVFSFISKIEPPGLRSSFDRLKVRIISLEEPRPFDVFDTIQGLAKFYEKSFEREAAQMLAENIGNNPYRLDSEIQKLILTFPSSGAFSVSDVATISGFLREDMILKIHTLLAESQLEKAICLTHSLLKRGENVLGIVGLIARFARDAMLVSPHLKKTSGFDAIAKATAVKPYFIKMLARNQKHWNEQKLSILLAACSRGEKKFKEGAVTPELLVGEIICQVQPDH